MTATPVWFLGRYTAPGLASAPRAPDAALLAAIAISQEPMRIQAGDGQRRGQVDIRPPVPCHATHLVEIRYAESDPLELQFCANAWDDEHFRHIGSTDSRLTIMRAHRYGGEPSVGEVYS